MAKAFAEITAGGEADGLGHHEWLGLLLDREASWRQDKRFAARLRVAKLRQQACVEDVDYRNPRGLDRALFQKLAEGEWINAHDNLALIGPTGVEDNWDLSVKRATSVVRVLQKEYGMDPAKIAAAGRGEYKPIADNSTKEGKAANRRTRIVILPQLDQFFKLLEPNKG